MDANGYLEEKDFSLKIMMRLSRLLKSYFTNAKFENNRQQEIINKAFLQMRNLVKLSLIFDTYLRVNSKKLWINDWGADIHTSKVFIPFRILCLEDEYKIRNKLDRLNDSPNSLANMNFFRLLSTNIPIKNPAGESKFFNKMVWILTWSSYFSWILQGSDIDKIVEEKAMEFFAKYSKYSPLQYLFSYAQLQDKFGDLKIIYYEAELVLKTLEEMYKELLLNRTTYNNWEMIQPWEKYENG